MGNIETTYYFYSKEEMMKILVKSIPTLPLELLDIISEYATEPSIIYHENIERLYTMDISNVSPLKNIPLYTLPPNNRNI